MFFQFAPAIQAGIEAGKYAQVFTSEGVPVGLARDVATGKFVAHSVGIVNNGVPLDSFIGISQWAINAGQSYQNQFGLQAIQIIQNSVTTLQATTALIGVGAIANVGLSAANLWQTIKLRKEVEQLGQEIRDGFIDLKKIISIQGIEILRQIKEVAEDMEFRQHRTILSQGYGHFLEATRLIKTAISCKNPSVRNTDLANARQTLNEALADYNNPQIFSQTCAAGRLRRFEIAWAIDQTIALTYQLQNEYAAVSDRLRSLQERIYQDFFIVIEQCKNQAELDFIFPEITLIHERDLVLLKYWQARVDWLQSLPENERQMLGSLEITTTQDRSNSSSITKPPELVSYENLQSKSHYHSLRNQLIFMLKPEVREEHEAYITEKARLSGYKSLASSNLKEVSNLTIANLYSYFK